MTAKQEVLGIIRGEHQSVAAVVDALKYLSRDMAAGALMPDFKLAWSMIYYIEEFPEQMHHPKEDSALFPRLRGRNLGIEETLERLERQHETATAHFDSMKTWLGRMEADIPGAKREFARQVNNYAIFHHEHLSLEESVILPKAKECLLDEDWEAIAADFARATDPVHVSWVSSEDWFRDFYGRVVAMVPQPWGFAARRQPVAFGRRVA